MEDLGLWTRKAVEQFKPGLSGCPSRNMEDNAKGSLGCGSPAQEVSEGKNTVSTWPRDQSRDILA